MADAKTSGVAAAAIGAGIISLYAGITGKDVLSLIKNGIQGNSPHSVPQTAPVTSDLAAIEASSSEGQEATGGAAGLAADAATYAGHPYSYGGYESDPAGWDCSSFMNWVVGHDGGLAIPGVAAGQYNGTNHGPPTGAWLLWSGVEGISQAQLQPGDLCVWETHMGMAVGGGQMVSALNPQLGTAITTISGGAPTGELLFCKRIKALIL
jgi:peptidoglycan DL-endopeptidase CwlO